MDKVQLIQKNIDDALKQKNAFTDFLDQISKKVGVPKKTIVYGVIGFVAIYLIIGYGSNILANVIGFLYPAYASIKAIESAQPQDDTKWLTYWVTYATFGIVEIFADILLFWIPFYSFIKCLFLLWLMAPIENNGSIFLYHKVIRPYILKYEGEIDGAMNKIKDKTGEMVNNAKNSAASKMVNNMAKMD